MLPAPSHSTVRSEAVVRNVGPVVSSMVKVSVVSTWFPQSSVMRKFTLACPVAAQPSVNMLVVFSNVTPPQLSVAVELFTMFNQASISATLPVPSHSTVTEPPFGTKVGGVVSSMVKTAEDVALLPAASVCVKITVMAPVSPHRSDMLAAS